MDAPCPHCHVMVHHVGPDAAGGSRLECGLCGGVSEVVKDQDGTRLSKAALGSRAPASERQLSACAPRVDRMGLSSG